MFLGRVEWTLIFRPTDPMARNIYLHCNSKPAYYLPPSQQLHGCSTKLPQAYTLLKKVRYASTRTSAFPAPPNRSTPIYRTSSFLPKLEHPDIRIGQAICSP
ncbi:hypothetical protein MIMGU_mgv1a016911mg [Erythranthe guttata]|uniref:Uncharacterized protein n=1 Tax=Erythranthe guttata TaxID=4155 RepID=A0A022QDQ8_ERYGU|nr:hypothetical protein MIMGU_mgv1a016911mg [Erythranthe guttata]